MAQNIICNDNNRKHTHKICHFVPYKLYIFICLSNFTHTHRISFNSMLSLLWLFFHSKVSNKVPTSSIFIFNWVKLNTLRKFTINSSSSSNFNFLGSAFFYILSCYLCDFIEVFSFTVSEKRFRISQSVRTLTLSLH